MKIEVLRIHEDYVTTTIFTLMLLNGLLVPVTPNLIFETDRKNVKRRTGCFSEEFCASARKKDSILSVYKSSSMKSIWEPPLIVSSACCRSTNRFPSSLTPFLLKQIKAIRAFAKHLRKTSNIAGVLEPRNYSTVVSSDGERAKIPHNYRGRLSFTSVSFSADEGERINAS